jgi:pyruvate dehydrogenase E1 component
MVDGMFQKSSVEPGSYGRTLVFGPDPDLAHLVNHLTDEQVRKLMRGGHDPRKVFAAYKAAVEHKGAPTVILAKTIKGYGLGEAGEGRNVSHQQKALNEKELREFRSRFHIPLDDDEVVEAPFYRPPEGSPEQKYLMERRHALGGFVPTRRVAAEPLEVPPIEDFKEFLKGSSGEATTTMAFVRMLGVLLRNKKIGKRIVPIIPDEARTFGMDPLFREIGIYSPKGQLYEPVDRASLLYYRESKTGQILEEGITEAGSMSSLIAAGTSYSTHGFHMLPFFIFYSMFGLQRIGDLVWAAADMGTRGFMLGATAGRTTLNGEGLQHQDGHSHVLASTIPTLVAYDPAFAYEVAVIIQDGMRRMYQEDENVLYYMTLYNEGYPMPAMPESRWGNVREGIIEGMYRFRPGPEGKVLKAHIFGSGPILNSALEAQTILAERYDVSADVWSVTSYKKLRNDALKAARWNMLHPGEPPRLSYIERQLVDETGVFVAVSDYMKIVPDQIAQWVPGGLVTLGTDGFGRSDTRPALRRFFEVDAEMTVIATLYGLARKQKIPMSRVQSAIGELGVDPEKPFPFIV